MGRETREKGPPKQTPLLKHLPSVRVTLSTLLREWSSQGVLSRRRDGRGPLRMSPREGWHCPKDQDAFHRFETLAWSEDRNLPRPSGPAFFHAARTLSGALSDGLTLGIASEDSAFVTSRGRLALTCQAEPRSSVDRAGGFRGPPKQRIDCSAQNNFYD